MQRASHHHGEEIVMPTRNATATWEGGLAKGKGRFEGESGAIKGTYSFNTRFGTEKGTNPEELLAAAHSACFSMALANGLERAGKPATSVETRAAATIEKVGEAFKITTMKLDVRAKVPGIDKPTFDTVLEGAKKGCPVSNALAGVKIEVNAQLV
jgi:osmotically inducible protein OsmC